VSAVHIDTGIGDEALLDRSIILIEKPACASRSMSSTPTR
jgi:hypothetical protein